jgi:hypothetical protein
VQTLLSKDRADLKEEILSMEQRIQTNMNKSITSIMNNSFREHFSNKDDCSVIDAQAESPNVRVRVRNQNEEDEINSFQMSYGSSVAVPTMSYEKFIALDPAKKIKILSDIFTYCVHSALANINLRKDAVVFLKKTDSLNDGAKVLHAINNAVNGSKTGDLLLVAGQKESIRQHYFIRYDKQKDQISIMHFQKVDDKIKKSLASATAAHFFGQPFEIIEEYEAFIAFDHASKSFAEFCSGKLYRFKVLAKLIKETQDIVVKQLEEEEFTSISHHLAVITAVVMTVDDLSKSPEKRSFEFFKHLLEISRHGEAILPVLYYTGLTCMLDSKYKVTEGGQGRETALKFNNGVQKTHNNFRSALQENMTKACEACIAVNKECKNVSLIIHMCWFFSHP